MAEISCSCDTKKPYSECCEPVIRGRRKAATPAELMRARYTSFVRQEIDFIVDSVAPARKKEVNRKEIEDWSKNTRWSGLEIVSTEKGGPEDDKGKVEFIARFQEDDGEKQHHELATFVKHGGSWFFDDGRIPPPKTVRREGPEIGRNDPCYCGSGKKFKKCHGA